MPAILRPDVSLPIQARSASNLLWSNSQPVTNGQALPVGHGAMLQASVGGNVLRGLRRLAPARRCQQVARENNTPPATLGQSLFDHEAGALA